MPSGKRSASVPVTTHLPTDFHRDVKCDSRLDSHSSHTLCVSQILDRLHTAPCESRAILSGSQCWVWRHRCFSCSKTQLSSPAALCKGSPSVPDSPVSGRLESPQKNMNSLQKLRSCSISKAN